MYYLLESAANVHDHYGVKIITQMFTSHESKVVILKGNGTGRCASLDLAWHRVVEQMTHQSAGCSIVRYP